jgi:hypothetical protein
MAEWWPDNWADNGLKWVDYRLKYRFDYGPNIAPKTMLLGQKTGPLGPKEKVGLCLKTGQLGLNVWALLGWKSNMIT